MKRHQKARLTLASVSISAIAIALRAGPLYWSPYPFNPDGIVYSALVRVTRIDGHLPLRQVATDEYQFTSLLTVLAEIAGTPALYIGQPAIAIIGALPVLLAIGVVVRVLRERDWSSRDVSYAALVAGALLAIEGVYLHRAMAVDEQTLGLFFVPLACILLARVHETRDQRLLVLLSVVLIALPPTHNLDSVLMGIFLLLWVSVALGVDGWTRLTALNGVLAIGYWIYFLGYNLVIETLTPSVIIQADRLTSELSLFLAWIVLVALTVPWLFGLSERAKRLGLLGTIGAFFLVIILNTLTPIFPAMPSTSTRILVLSAPLAIVALVASVAIGSVDRIPIGRALALLIGAVAVLVGVSLTASLTPEYLNTLYRVSTFLHFPILVLAGIGAARLLRSSTVLKTTPRRSAVAGILLICAAASLPIAFGGLDLLVYKGTTSPAELSASQFATEHVPAAWATDDHLARIHGYYGNGSSPQRGPAYSYVGGGPEPSVPMLSQWSWTTTGAQTYPSAPVRIPATRYQHTIATRNVVYATGAGDVIQLSLPR